MLSKAQRITRSLFPAILKRGKSLHSPHFSLKYLVSSGGPQFSLVTSKRIVKQAVSRHLLKRRVYATLKEVSKAQNPMFSGVFFAKKGSGELPFKTISQEIKGLFSNARS